MGIHNTKDINVPGPGEYWFLGVTTAVTAKGYFVDANQRRTGNSFSTTIPAGTGTQDPVQIATAPAAAVGVIFSLSGEVHIDIAEAASSDFETNYVNYPVLGPEDGRIKLGVAH